MRRLAVEEAIKLKMSPMEIHSRKQAYAAHLQWMMSQRRVMERIVQMADNKSVLVENSDKCGDSSIFIPADLRINGANTGRYKYRLALQANVYAGKLYHLSLLLPNLTTGANFGIQSMVNGLVRMIQLGEVTPETRKFMRGIDGGSENENISTLALNSILVGKPVRRFDVVQQNRLPPSHSHHWLTDGTFSVIEGWMTGDGFAGCATLKELIEYLRMRFERAANYKTKRVEIGILVLNFAWVKWFSGHVNSNKVVRIGDPLVWRHTWVPETESVLVQYKYALSDGESFEKSEWGPWVEKVVQVEDTATGEWRAKTVLRSDPAGIDLLRSLPDIHDDPGVEDWMDFAEWKGKRIFDDIGKWTFNRNGEQHRSEWQQLRAWHAAYPTADSVSVGDHDLMGDLASGASMRPELTWQKMWQVIALTPEAVREVSKASSDAQEPSTSSASSTFLNPMSKTVDREGLASSTSVAELNRVRDSRNTKQHIAGVVAQDEGNWQQHCASELTTKGALWMIRLGHYEGEFPLGLGRRTFNTTTDSDTVVEIEWFERKGKQKDSWGKQPAFRLTTASYDGKRRPISQKTVEKVSNFLPIVVGVTRGSKGADEPTVSQSCMSALRSLAPKPLEDGSESDEEPSDEEGEEEESDEGSDEESDSEPEEESEPSDEESEGSCQTPPDAKRKRKDAKQPHGM